jgi:hypothetical protein
MARRGQTFYTTHFSAHSKVGIKMGAYAMMQVSEYSVTFYKAWSYGLAIFLEETFGRNPEIRKRLALMESEESEEKLLIEITIISATFSTILTSSGCGHYKK